MLLNPQLKDMSCEDLSQRFIHSYIPYDGKISYVQSVDQQEDEDGRRCTLLYLKQSDKKDDKKVTCVQFDWEKVDCTRPEAQYHMFQYRERRIAGYFQLTSGKQFSRGLTRNNCFITSPMRYGVGLEINCENLTTVFSEPKARHWKIRMHWKDAEAQLMIDDLVLQANLALIRHNRDHFIFWRRTHIADLLPNGIVSLRHPLFKDEIQESLMDVRFVNHRIRYENEYPDEKLPASINKSYKGFQWRDMVAGQDINPDDALIQLVAEPIERAVPFNAEAQRRLDEALAEINNEMQLNRVANEIGRAHV